VVKPKFAALIEQTTKRVLSVKYRSTLILWEMLCKYW